MSIDVRDDPDRHRYEVFLDGQRAGFTSYRQEPGQITFDHTEVDERFGGKGVGSGLVRGVLDDARRRELAVLPVCPFVNRYIKGHTEYADLVPAERRAQFGL